MEPRGSVYLHFPEFCSVTSDLKLSELEIQPTFAPVQYF